MTPLTVGASFAIVTVAVLVVGGLIPSSALSVAVTTASSLHVSVGVSVVSPVGVHTVPGSAPDTAKDQSTETGSLSGSDAVRASGTGGPWEPVYGTPASPDGAALTRIVAVYDDWPPSLSPTVTVTV